MSDEPKVTLLPSEQLIQKANTVTTIVAGAMRIGIKKPGILTQYRIVEVVGESAKNEVYMGMINPVLWVVQIDDEDVPTPGTKRELEALISRLGEDGVIAIAHHLSEQVTTSDGVASIKN